jgi:hypothetical protein
MKGKIRREEEGNNETSKKRKISRRNEMYRRNLKEKNEVGNENKMSRRKEGRNEEFCMEKKETVEE